MHDERGSGPPSPCPTSSQTNGADRLLRHVGADQADLRRIRLRARPVELWDRADLLVSSQLVYPEARAALAAATRACRIDRPTHVRAVATLEELYAQLRIVAIDEPLARYAGDLAAEYAPRGYDALHLACALHLQGDDILLATWDKALNAAARASGRLIVSDAG